MNWKAVVAVAFTILWTVNARPGIRSPPARYLDENEEHQGTPMPILSPNPTNTVGEVPLVTNRRIFATANVHKSYEKLNPNESHDEFKAETEPVRMGVAVPLSPEDFEKEMNFTHAQKVSDSSTQKEGISTWILLSGGGPTKEPETNRSSYRYEAKIEKVQKIDEKSQNRRTTLKPKEKLSATPKAPKTTKTTPTTERPEKVENKVEKNPPTRPKKPLAEGRPPLVTKKQTKKTTTAAVTSTASSTTPSTSTSVEVIATSGVSSTTPETTTFLILEPKDADFDLPQDRSPGPTTKKPKRNNNKNTKTKKNKNKTDVEKKPSKPNPVKDKPLSTKIYNYLAREVMPTVGVGLVGLVVTAGLATYFLGPFGSLRRSYDVADRKDDVYFYNNEEYAGPDGQTEEEVFGKVIAGMPANSPYRNSIKYTVYRGNQNKHGQSQRPVRYDPQYPPPAQYNRYRNSGFGYQGQGQQPPHPVYNKPKPQDAYPSPQNFYRYNSDGTAYRANSEEIKSAMKRPEGEDETKQQNNIDTTPGPSIVTPQSFTENDAEPSIEDNNVLRRRSQFVVGSVEPLQSSQSQSVTDQLTVDSVPEHGPRRRRRDITKLYSVPNDVDDEDNEIEGVAPIKVEISSTPLPSDDSMIPDETTTSSETNNHGTLNSNKQNIFDLIRSIFEIKVRMGLSFLQNTTDAFQRYLKRVEKRVDESKLFSKDYRTTTK